MESQSTNPSISGVPMGSLTQTTLFKLDPVVKQQSHNEKVNAIKKANLARRNEMIREKANQKYNVERKRFDDVVAELMAEFSLSKTTIEDVLKG